MSTHQWMDRICVIAVAFALLLTVVLINGETLGIQRADKAMGYADRLFDTSRVHTIDIVMDDWDSFIETCENEEYAACTVVIDGERCSNVGIRAKGNTSLSSVSSMGSDRYSFKIEFDQYNSGSTYHGLDKLSLNNLIQDNTMMKDYLVYRMMGEFGAASPLCSYAYITVNGEDWGLYLAVEAVEESFLQRNYGSDYGELYKPDSMEIGGGRGNGRDFTMEEMPDYVPDDTQPQTRPEETGAAEESTAPAEQSTAEPSETAPPNGMMPPDAAGQPPGEMDEPPPGMLPPGGVNDEMPQMPDGQAPSGLPQNRDASAEPDSSTADSAPAAENTPDQTVPDDETETAPFCGKMPGGMGGMGSEDVKLQYIDDDPSSYANIFDNAKTYITEADQMRLIASLKALSAGENIESAVSVEEVIRYFVVHNFVVNGDSYTGSMVHNYYLYEKDGRLSMLPWDYNLAFGTFQGGSAENAVNQSIDSPVSGGDVTDRPMMAWILADEQYIALYHQYFAEFLQTVDAAAMIEETYVLIAPYVEKDSSKFCTTGEFEAGVSALTTFVQMRSESVSRQLSGDDTPVDTTGLALSDMGSMGMGGRGERGGRTEMTAVVSGQVTAEDTQTQPDGVMQLPDAESMTSSGQGEMAQRIPGATGTQQPFDRSDADPGARQPGDAAAQSAGRWLLLGGSVLILLGGLVFAFRFKR